MRSEQGGSASHEVDGTGTEPKHVCPHFHAAVELIGRRWAGAILYSLADDGPMRFAEVKEAVPGMSDRLLSTRLKELETVPTEGGRLVRRLDVPVHTAILCEILG